MGPTWGQDRARMTPKSVAVASRFAGLANLGWVSDRIRHDWAEVDAIEQIEQTNAGKSKHLHSREGFRRERAGQDRA